MYQPMQDGRVFFAGDTAHLITPAGGKGMNIAIQDAAELAAGLRERFGECGRRATARPLLGDAASERLAPAGVLERDARPVQRARRRRRRVPTPSRTASAVRASTRSSTTRASRAGSRTRTPASTSRPRSFLAGAYDEMLDSEFVAVGAETQARLSAIIGVKAPCAMIVTMACDEDLANRIRELIVSEDGYTEQKMFGGIGPPPHDGGAQRRGWTDDPLLQGGDRGSPRQARCATV